MDLLTKYTGWPQSHAPYYSQDNPHFILDSKEHSGPKIMVWCGLWRDHVLGPFFFNETVTGERYLNMLQIDLIPQFHLLGDGRPTWFMQDDAPPHYAKIVRDWLHENFENWIGRRGTVE